MWARVDGVDLRYSHEVCSAHALPDGRLLVDDHAARAVAVCVPEPQKPCVFSDELSDALPDDEPVWEAVNVLTAVLNARFRPDLDGVFVNDDPVITRIADDGQRRGDGAPVLVAHVNPVLTAQHLERPSDVVPMVLVPMQHVLGLTARPY